MDNIAIDVLLSFVSVLLTINLYILKGLRGDLKGFKEDLKEGIGKLWEKIDGIIEKHDHTVERLARMEADVYNCTKRWDRRHPEE